MRFLRERRLGAASAAAIAGGTIVAGCLAIAPEPQVREWQTDDDAGAEPPTYFDASVGPADAKADIGSSDPHSLLGAEPSHGPFHGGQRTVLLGKGFASEVHVWFADAAVDPATIVPIDSTRVEVEVPPGTAGPVDVSIQNGDDESTRRTVASGYVYDKLYAAPDEGPVPGGEVIEIVGQGTQWDATTVIRIDQKPCTELEVKSPTLASCTVPPGTPGAKTVSATTGAETITVLDGYTYADSDNGYKGGLSGDELAGHIKILVYDNFYGFPIPGAFAIVGTSIGTSLIGTSDASGVVVIDDPTLTEPETVTVAAKCYSPISFVDVPVDTVTVYLDPVMSPACGKGDPTPVGGKPSYNGSISGEIYWEGGVEMQKAPWVGLPAPKGDDERQAAYVFVAAADPTTTFQLPAETEAVTNESPGSKGYGFSLSSVTVGNRAIYALAGIENRTAVPPKFTAYMMGVATGVSVLPNETTENVYIPMTKMLDHALTLAVDVPPPGPKGPDRLRALVAIMLGNDGYALLPNGQQTPLIPVLQDLQFVGVPSLDGALAGASYHTAARAVTGPVWSAPMSVLARLLTTTTSQPVPVSGFVGVPTLVTPPANGAWDGQHLAVTFEAGGKIDETVYEVSSANGLVKWTLVVPGGDNSITIPDLSGFDMAGIPPGPVVIGVYGGRVEAFDYPTLRYRDIRSYGMSAYSLDYFNAHL